MPKEYILPKGFISVDVSVMKAVLAAKRGYIENDLKSFFTAFSTLGNYGR